MKIIQLCADCNSPISRARMTVNPGANRCIVCQNKFEEKSDTRKKIHDISSATEVSIFKPAKEVQGHAVAFDATSVCPHCGISAPSLEKHLRKAHFHHKKVPKKNASKVVHKYRCEVCSAGFDSSHLLLLHRENFHTRTISIKTPEDVKSLVKNASEGHKQKIEKMRKKRPKDRNLFCPICNIKFINESGVSMHVSAVHVLTSKKHSFLSSKKSHKTRLLPSGQSQKQQQTNNLLKSNKESSFDGSRDFYKNYRENGKLGSHPSHDAYGDEDFA